MPADASPRPHIAVLDGLRFIAAFCVMLCHYSYWVLGDQGVSNEVTQVVGTLAGIGMALFFTLSGFVIHYNYQTVCAQPGGKWHFFVARFTRLYPLYLLMFIIEFTSSFHYHRGSCGLAHARGAYFLALPYYLTLTQGWVYGTFCTNNLIYQYHMVSSVCWSLSVEAFFYLSYMLVFYKWSEKKTLLTQLCAAFAAMAVTVLLLLCVSAHETAIDSTVVKALGPIAGIEHGYQDSFLRWLYYFSPYSNLAAFFCGIVAANIYMQRKDLPKGSFGPWLVPLSLIMVLAVHFYFYLDISRTYAFIGHTASTLYVPVIAFAIYCCARYPANICSRVIGSRLFVKLGQASYSMYLLHAFFGWNARDYYYLKLNPWLLYAIAISCVIGISCLSYRFFERPAQRWLRAKILGSP